MIMNNDASSCHHAPLTACLIMKHKKDDVTCQTQSLPANNAAHLMMRDGTKDVAIALIKGIIHPVAELHQKMQFNKILI